MKKAFNSLKSKNHRVIKITNGLTVRFKNDAGDDDEPAEVMLYDDIGRSPWSDGGISATDFANALAAIPRTKAINFRINSRGGDVHDGMAMHNLISQWPNKTKATIDGVAASTASWIPMACDEIDMPATAQMFIHDAMCFTAGNAEQLRKDADDLDTTSDQIASMYAEKSGKTVDEMRQKMKDETLMTGTQAKELGLVDNLTDGKPMHNFSAQEMDSMKEKLALMRNSKPKGEGQPISKKPVTTHDDNLMNKTQMLALLNKHGVKYTDAMTDAELLALVNAIPVAKTEPAPTGNDAKILDLENRIKSLTEADNTAKKLRIENAIQAAIDGDKIPATQKANWVEKAMKDESILEMVNALPAQPPGAAPLPKLPNQTGSESSFNEVQKYMLDLGPNFSRNFLGNKSGNEVPEQARKEIGSRAIMVTNTYRKHRNMLKEMYNTNTISSDLQRIVLLQEMLEEFAIGILPLKAFSVVFNNIPLEGTDKVGVPFYPLQTAASNSWAAATGYASGSMQSSVTNIREVTVGGIDGSSGSSAPANTANDRKWQGLAFDSYTLRRQPFFNALKLVQQNANKLGVDIFNDIVSRVITAANYGASVKATPAQAFSSSDITDLYSAATTNNWPLRNRSLVLDHRYNASLLNDPTFKYVLNAGTDEALRQGVIRSAYGFEDIEIVPNLSSYSPAGQNLTGWINWLYAMLVATSPIMPAPGVRNLLIRYDVVTDPKTGISFEYREMANATLDQDQYIAECSYGANLGVASALQRITSA